MEVCHLEEEYCSMRSRSWAGLVLMALAVLSPTSAAFAGYGAIAWDKETGKRGSSWNQPTSEKAAAAAVSQCGASGCRVIMRTVAKQCAAMATTSDGKSAVGASVRNTQDAARLAALSGCKKRGAGECVVQISDCNK
jgi:hypothetical protein